MGVDFREWLIVLRAHIGVAMALTLVACSLLSWQMMRKPKLYMTGASLVFERGERLEMGDRGEPGLGEAISNTRVEQLKSSELLQRVAASFTPEEAARIIGPEVKGAKPSKSETTLHAAVSESVVLDRRPGTNLIYVQAIHTDPDVAALLANRYAALAVPYLFERVNAGDTAALSFLRSQSEDMRKKAEMAERSLQEYRQRYNLVSLEANQNIIVDSLKALNASATGARVARVAAEARLEQAEAVLKRGEDATQVASITNFEGLNEVSQRLADLRGRRAVMAERYGRRHPSMQENDRAIESVEKLRDEYLRTAMASLRDLRDKAISEERQLSEQRAKAEKEALDLDQLGVEYNILRSAVESHKASYSQMLARLNEATMSAQLRGVSLRISGVAFPPSTPFSPNVRKTVMAMVGLGLVILLGYPFSAEMFFGRIRSASDVEFHLGAELLGEIGSVQKIKEKDRPTIVKGDRDEAAAEQFRALYSQFTLTSKIDSPKVLLITSTLPGEGKSFIAANLAASLVAHGRRVLLVDADLRRPAQHRHFGLKNEAGLVRWIEDGGVMDGDILKDPRLGLVEVLPGLFLMRAGGLSRKATELIASPRVSELFAALQRKFDLVILDTPPAGVFSDAVGFARVAHEFIYICRFNAASRQAVRSCLDRLRQTGLEFPGVVLNAMPSGFAGSYYYRGYSYQSAKYYARRYRVSAD